MLVSIDVYSQNIELVNDLHHVSVYNGECEKDNNGKDCAVIDVIIPKAKIRSIECDYKMGEIQPIDNGVRFFIVIPQSKKKVRVIVENYQTIEFEVKNVIGHQRYEINYQVPDNKQKTDVVNQQPKPQIIEKENYVDIHIEKEPDAFLFVDGISYGQNHNTVSVSANSKHTIKINKNGYIESKTIKVYQNNFTVIMPKVSNNQIVQSGWFMGCTFSPQLMSAGFSIGFCKRGGFILNCGFSKLAFSNWYDRNLENGNLLDTFKISNIYSDRLLDNNQLNNSRNKGMYRSYIRIGPMFRIFDFMYLYGALGCGTYADVKSYDGQPFAPKIHNGFEGEAGIMLKYNRLALSFGYIQGVDRENLFSDYHIGLNYWMKVLKKKVNPEHRFIVGYKYSPSAPYGMSLGVAFGYYEKWGLLMHGGSSEYLIREGMMLGYYSFEGEEPKGRCRSYYHIGPFFRMNDIFAYYITIGYGSYKPDYESIWEGYYAGGWDGEVGIMLKLWRLGFSVGYQHNIGKKNLFQDISVGVQFWLGK